VVSTDCPHGPAEVLGDGRWGKLVPVGDAAKLASAMAEALAAPVDAAVQRARAAEFSVERAIDGYWQALSR
jgi:glycosyltransferase involved in cell wall biosynthesis